MRTGLVDLNAAQRAKYLALLQQTPKRGPIWPAWVLLFLVYAVVWVGCGYALAHRYPLPSVVPGGDTERSVFMVPAAR